MEDGVKVTKENSDANAHGNNDDRIVNNLLFCWPGYFAKLTIGSVEIIFDFVCKCSHKKGGSGKGIKKRPLASSRGEYRGIWLFCQGIEVGDNL